MQLKDYEIIDFHTHPFIRTEDNICSHKLHCDMSTENIIRDMKLGGISKMCGAPICRDADMRKAVRDSNDAMLTLMDKLGDFYVPGMAVHPDYVDESIADMDAMYARGVRLIGELVPYMHGWKDYSCEGFSKLLDHAEEKNMLVSIHSMGEDEMDEMVRRHPNAKIIFAHPGEYRELMRHFKRIKMSENCYLDLSGYGIFRHGMLRAAIDELGIDRIIFGSDYPTCNPYMYVGGVMFDPMITDAEKEAIFSGNVRRLFKSVGVTI